MSSLSDLSSDFAKLKSGAMEMPEENARLRADDGPLFGIVRKLWSDRPKGSDPRRIDHFG